MRSLISRVLPENEPGIAVIKDDTSQIGTHAQHERRTEAMEEQRPGPGPSTPQAQSPSQKTAGAPKVYTGDTATGGRTPRRRYISTSSVARLPPSEWPCA